MNTEENLDYLIAHWKDFITFSKLKIMFVNPIVNEQWSLFPKTHDAISDKESLQTGLTSLFSSVPAV